MSGSSSSLAEQSANRIADMILEEKRFQEGDKLPNEMELAELLSVSRVTLREPSEFSAPAALLRSAAAGVLM